MKRWSVVAGLIAAIVVTSATPGATSAHRAASTGTGVTTVGTFRALLIGIEDYAPDGAGGPDLSFPDEDLDDVASTLASVYGIK